MFEGCLSCCVQAITAYTDEEDFGHGWATDLYDCCKDSANCKFVRIDWRILYLEHNSDPSQ